METVFASDLELEGELCTLASSMQLLAMCGRPPGGRPEGEGGGGEATQDLHSRSSGQWTEQGLT